MQDYLAGIYSPALEPKLDKAARRKTDFRQGRRRSQIRKGKQDDRPVIRPTQMDVLERPRGRPGIHARPDRRARRRVQGMRRGHQDGEDSRLPGRHQHHGLQETDVQEIEEMFEFFSSLEVDGHTISPGYEYDAAKKDMVKRLGKQPEDFFLTREMTRREIREDPGMGRALHHFRHAGLSGISRRQTRADLHRLGHSRPATSRAGKRRAT